MRLAIPISPLAKPRPSTKATITEAPVVVVTEEQLVATYAEKSELEAQTQLSDAFRAGILVGSVKGVRAGWESVTPAVLWSLGVPPWLQRGELSEVDTSTDEVVRPGWGCPESRQNARRKSRHRHLPRQALGLITVD